MFTDGNIASQKFLVNALKRSEKIADIGPKSFNGIAMDFPNAIAIIIARPFFRAVTHCRMRSQNMVVALILIGKNLSPNRGELMDMSA
jgi:hypothetical protein